MDIGLGDAGDRYCVFLLPICEVGGARRFCRVWLAQEASAGEIRMGLQSDREGWIEGAWGRQ